LNVKIKSLVGDSKKTTRVVRVLSAEDGKPHLEDKFICKLDRSTAQRTSDEYTLTKDEVVFRIADSKETELKLIKEWDLFIALTQFRTVATLHLLLDIESTMKRLSLAFQGQDLTPSVVFNGITDTYDRLEMMKETNGMALEFTAPLTVLLNHLWDLTSRIKKMVHLISKLIVAKSWTAQFCT